MHGFGSFRSYPQCSRYAARARSNLSLGTAYNVFRSWHERIPLPSNDHPTAHGSPIVSDRCEDVERLKLAVPRPATEYDNHPRLASNASVN